ncbi:protein ANTI-SILENCING 1 isoform X3 [Vigna unguiculata]|uniref:protein ANTI-SILENCING 1 isoform X3 n=1 Tax=Vigna unguiculata TaxID=3917 RepID=UPI0010169972|nr:protein ANTI-SILENCING 1 isoform X3 [Vigna unguiculata]
MVEAGEEVIEFKWGNMRSVGGRKKDVRFFDSFFYDGVEYSLFDSVFLYKEGEPEHYIGKIIKIWETADKNKRVKVLWYFRPSEIVNFLEGNDALENELFLASGEGEGLANVNPLEAIAGKCNIICISKDSRNPYPSYAEVKMAEFVFHRFFDVGKCKILDKIDDKIAGIEVKNIFNKLDSRKHVDIVKPCLEKKEVSGNYTAYNEAVALLSQNNSQPLIEKPDGKCFDALAREKAVSKSSLGKKPTLRTGVKEASELNDSLHLVSNNKSAPQDKVEENGGHKASFVKQKTFSKLSHGSRTGLKMAKLDNGHGNDFIEKNISTSRVNLGKDDHEDVDVSVGQFNKGLVEEMASKKENRGGFGKVSSAKMNNIGKSRKLIIYDDDDDSDDDVKIVAPSSSKDKYKLQGEVDSCDVEELPSKRLKVDKTTKLTSDKLCKDSSVISSNVELKRDFHPTEVTRRPDDPWEEKMKSAFEQGKLVLLQNLDPSLSSSEVQNIIWTGFKERCTAKVFHRTDYTSPHSGQAFAIFKKVEAAAKVVRELDEGCLLLSNGLPLVGSFGVPYFPEKKPVFYGHHVVDQLRMQMQREMKDAVSTSHCSQPNNIEYDMAIEWCLLQERANKSLRILYKQQGEQLRKLKAKLKSKT